MRCLTLCFAVVLPIVAALLVGVYHTALANTLTLTPVDLHGRTVMITGATAGIGLESAKIMASWGAELVLPVRDVKRGANAKHAILSQTPQAKVSVVSGVDFQNLASVRQFARDFVKSGRALHVLMNNAGMAHLIGGEPTPDGLEQVFQVNHVAPYLLTKELVPALERAAQTGEARVVFVSSMAHYGGKVDRAMYSAAGKGGINVFRMPLGRYDDSKCAWRWWRKRCARVGGLTRQC
jgi:NAD(P)-dependent dehydrogenase (short-subunit alcohol dehydrogenase family)